jgi:predicted DNA-binding protein YlxM (UPF0122 family)
MKTYKPITKIRGLDTDDLYMMAYFHDGYTLTEISTLLRLSPPAITSRFKKIHSITGIKVYTNIDKRIIVTSSGATLCALAHSVIDSFKEHFKSELVPISQAQIDSYRYPAVKKSDHGFVDV